MADKLTPQQILDTPMESNDAEATTIRGYLVELLHSVWTEREGFSGKRPFGNSGWSWDLYAALVAAGHVKGKTDADGYLEDVDERTADRLVSAAIKALGEAP